MHQPANTRPVVPTDEAVLANGWRWDSRVASPTTSTVAAPDDDARLEAWRTQVDPDAIGTFDKRLRWSGLTTADAVALLAAHPDPSERPDWWPDLEALRAACRSSATGSVSDAEWFADLHTSLPPARPGEPVDVPFAHLMWPVVRWAWSTLEERIDRMHLTQVSDAARDDLRRALLVRLSQLVARAVTEDFTADRPAGESLMLRLGVPGVGRTDSQVAYSAYCRNNLADGLDHILGEFPVLGRILAVVCGQWRTNVMDLLQRVDRDRSRLQSVLGVDPVHALEQVRWGLSDPHRGGRSVAILSFGSDQDRVEIVYKPKDIEIEQRFNDTIADILADLGGSGEPLIRTLLGDEGYGYVSFVKQEPCPAEMYPDFYRSAGRLLAVLHLLGSTDCHFENLIARGPELHLIDAETLFEGRTVEIGSGESVTLEDPLQASVLRIGMLPTWTVQKNFKPIDISALGAGSRTAETVSVPGWRHINTDAVIWASTDIVAPQPPSLPVDVGTLNPLVDHVEDLVAGFVELYELAMQPDASARIVSRVREFAGVRRRLVPRNTRTYAVLQERATSSKALRSSLVRGYELDRLSRSALLGEDRPAIWEAFLAELHDLENLDIPYFDYPLGSLEIHGGGRELPGILEHDGLTQSVERIQSLSTLDLAWQVRLIRGALAARYVSAMAAPQSHGDAAGSREPAAERPAPHAPTSARFDVDSLRDLVESSNFPDRTGAPSWLTLLPVGAGGTDALQFGLVDSGLYAGRVGIAAFISSGESPSSQQVAFAQAVLAPLERVLTSPDTFECFRFLRDSGLGVSGTGGFLRAFEVLARTELANVIDFDSLVAILLASITAESVAKDHSLDVISGAAGAISSLTRRHDRMPTDESQRALRLLADHLRLAQQPTTGAWKPAFGASRPLTGLGHGASGNGLALIQAGVALADDDLVEAGARGLRYEADVFDEAEGNWPDFRDLKTGPAFMVGWCAGAPGIGLARIQALHAAPEHPDAGRWRQDVSAAARATIAATSSPVDHLCCGNLGRALFLREAGAWADEPGWVDSAAAIEYDVRDRAEISGLMRLTRYSLGSGPGSEAVAPGLMQGLSGAGLYLRSVETDSRDLMTLIM